MTTIQMPEQAGVTPDSSLSALALYARQLGADGHFIVTGLIAQILADEHGLSPRDAIRLAEEGYDDRVSAVSRRVLDLMRSVTP